MANLKIINFNAAQKWGGQQPAVSVVTMPTATVTLETADCWLLSFTICNPSGAAGPDTVTIQDGAGGYVVNEVLQPGQTISGSLEYGTPMPGGITWSSTQGYATGKIVWHIPGLKP